MQRYSTPDLVYTAITSRGYISADATYGIHPTPFGLCLISVTAQGICHLSFVAEEEAPILPWRYSHLHRDDKSTAPLVQEIFAHTKENRKFSLLLIGTPFQVEVWQQLSTIPVGITTTYEAIAQQLGRPTATRAVATAIARNPIAYLIPCHRVVRKSGHMGGYRWGLPVKKLLLTYETDLD